MPRTEMLERGRRSDALRAWSDAYAQFCAADREMPLEPDDLERVARAAHLTGRDAEYRELLARAHQAYLERGDAASAARNAFWLGFGLMMSGEAARGSGWLARAQRLIDDHELDCVECGYLHVPAGLRCVAAGDFQGAHDQFTQAVMCADRFGDSDLAALARHGQGRARIKLGDVATGTALLDEAMVAIEAGDVSPVIAGTVYCSVIEACTEIFDVRRAQEWTASLTAWCESQPDLVPFRGQCLIRRAGILELHGEWSEALAEARRAEARLSDPPPPQAAAGLALHRQAEVHRMRGAFVEAEQAYREAARWLRAPQPGMALVRLAQGQVDAAAAAIRVMVEDAADTSTRADVLPAHVEIALAAGDVVAARESADELAGIAAQLDAPLLHARAAYAQGAVALAAEDAGGARRQLEQAWTLWDELDVPYEAARTRILIGLACRRLGDDDGAAVELDAARWQLEQLGAAPDAARAARLLGAARPGTTQRAEPRAGDGGLTEREVEVLRLIARGDTNKAIAKALFISEKTVHRHVSNIFGKLGVSTRAAATAWAFEHGIVQRS